ncbi:MAG: alanine racemase [Legionellaceae bacterium]|nr:alanine racemase [Legionellaceae bacterium]
MARPTRIEVDADALRHNVMRVKHCAPGRKIIAMVKANAYGCGVSSVVPALDAHVDAFGVACLEEARIVRKFTSRTCVLLQGVFQQHELLELADAGCEPVVHQPQQLVWILETPLPKAIRVWVKVDTGMHRLGFDVRTAQKSIEALKACPWVLDDLGVMTHLASADEPQNSQNQAQLELFNQLELSNTPNGLYTQSISNSAAILSCPEALADVVRPGIMLYGVSPFLDPAPEHTASLLDLKPVMQFVSEITAIHTYAPGAHVGYGGTWEAKRTSRIGVVAVGYGDGYPRHVAPNTPVFINGQYVPVVGRVSMDMLTVDLTDFEAAKIQLGTRVELWGKHLPVERIARAADTIGYELICQISPRVRAKAVII